MPLYRYQCDNCGYTFTSLEPVNTDHLKACERCGRLSARRSPARVGIVYKGSGFHATDYRRNGKARERTREKETEPEPEREREGVHHEG